MLKSKARKKPVVMELGGNAACVLDETWDDLDDAVVRVVHGGYYQSGQSCISVQRMLVHESVYDAFRQKLADAVGKLKAGDPKDEDTFIGPIISEKDAERIEDWVSKAVEAGAKLLVGGKRNGNMVEATLLEDVPRDCEASCREMFGPVVNLRKFTDFDDALREVNDSTFGLQAGIFTRDLYRMHRAWDELEVGGVIIGDVPSWRVDHMPYGGVKDSGLGREGIRWAIADMTEVRLLAVRTP
jgi:acyl-CoA reductase-like NAD-dependent aldehyde dehydrogenase